LNVVSLIIKIPVETFTREKWREIEGSREE
jgi:hypothetical protein